MRCARKRGYADLTAARGLPRGSLFMDVKRHLISNISRNRFVSWNPRAAARASKRKRQQRIAARRKRETTRLQQPSCGLSLPIEQGARVAHCAGPIAGNPESRLGGRCSTRASQLPDSIRRAHNAISQLLYRNWFAVIVGVYLKAGAIPLAHPCIDYDQDRMLPALESTTRLCGQDLRAADRNNLHRVRHS